MKSPPDELGRDEDAQAIDAVYAAMDKALGEAESREGRTPPSDQAVMAWRTAIDAFEEGYSRYAAILILGLRDADGQELPREARRFFLGLITRLLENKKRRGPPRREVRTLFKILCEAERSKDPNSRVAMKISIADKVIDEISKIHGVGVSTIKEIVWPRASRPPSKRNRVLGEPD